MLVICYVVWRKTPLHKTKHKGYPDIKLIFQEEIIPQLKMPILVLFCSGGAGGNLQKFFHNSEIKTQE